jgi:peptide-methionine (S)-S-oxide reductase
LARKSIRIAAYLLTVVALGAGLFFAFAPDVHEIPEHFPPPDAVEKTAGGKELATFASGCFWCTEAVMLQMKGVEKVVSGYAGGTVENPTYAQVCTGTTGHTECVQVTFDPAVVTYPELLEVFWRTHDPTTKDSQGWDVGSQYRSAIFYHTDTQRKLAESYKRKIDAANVFPRPLVTEIVPYTTFYTAEGYHQNFFAQNPTHSYCKSIIGPKVEKLKKVFGDKIKHD